MSEPSHRTRQAGAGRERTAVGRALTPSAKQRPDRPYDRWSALVADWQAGCLKCDAPVSDRPLPGSDGQLTVPLCDRHIRWAMASRRERLGKQAGYLKQLLTAWYRHHGTPDDIVAVRAWLGY